MIDMKNTILIIGVIFATVACLGQNQSYQKVGGAEQDWGQSIMKTSFPTEYLSIAGGTFSYGAGNSDFLLVKFAKEDGIVEWAKAIGGAGGDVLYAGIRTPGHYYALTGYTWSFAPPYPDPPYFALMLVKMNFDGTLEWARTVNGDYNDIGFSVAQTLPDYGFIVSGYTESYPQDSTDYSNLFVVKFSGAGDMEWARAIGWSFYDRAHTIIQTTDGGYIFTGQVGGYGAGSPTYDNLILCKLTSGGDVEWTRVVNGASGNEIGHDVIQTFDGGYAVAGVTWTFGVGTGDLFLLKFNSAGTLQWARTAGGSANDYGRSLIQLPDSSYIVSGSTSSFGGGGSDVFLVKFKSNGDFDWATTAGGVGNQTGASIVRSEYGDYSIAGLTEETGLSDRDILLVKLNFAGITCMGDTVTPEIRYVTPSISSPTITSRVVNPVVNSVTPTITDIPHISHSTLCRGGEDELAILVNTTHEGRHYISMEKAYQTCITRGLKKENIFVLHHTNNLDLDGDSRNDVRCLANEANLLTAFETWAGYRSDVATNLYVYMTDHGDTNRYPMVGGAVLTPSELDSMYKKYTSINDAYRINTVYNACLSGSFIDELSASGRVMMTSTSDSLVSYYVAGAYFGHMIWYKLMLGYNFKDTFNWAAALVREVIGDTKQIPLFDDNGDSVGHREPLPNGEDGSIGETITWGAGLASRSPMETPEILTITLEEIDDSIRFHAETSTPVDSCWVYIVRIDTSYDVPAGEEGVIDIPIVVLVETSPMHYSGSICKADYYGEYKFVAMAIAPPTGIHIVGDYTWPVCVDTIIHFGLSDDIITPDKFVLNIEPNPFNSACRIIAPENAIVSIFDVNGRHVTEFPGGNQIWRPSSSLGSGVYLVRAKAGEYEISKRVVYIK